MTTGKPISFGPDVKSEIQQYIKDRVCTHPGTGCWEWAMAVSEQGYGVAAVGQKKASSHRIAYAAFVADIPAGINVCHRCDNPSCCNPEHLFLGSQKDNIQDCIRKGRKADKRGERHHLSKLTDKDVRQIRSLKGAGLLPSQVALMYPVGRWQINAIWHNQGWTHVE